MVEDDLGAVDDGTERCLCRAVVDGHGGCGGLWKEIRAKKLSTSGTSETDSAELAMEARQHLAREDSSAS